VTADTIQLPITKVDDAFHLVYGVVYAPLAVDSHGETMTEEEVEKMCHDFLYYGRNANIDVMHNNEACGARVVESFKVREGDNDFGEHVGAWVVGIKIPEGDVWSKIKSGEYSGFSLQALARKVPRKVVVEVVRAASGSTEENDTDDLEKHSHEFVIEMDDAGRVTMGVTTETLGHTHKIYNTVSTDPTESHSHRYFI